MTIIIGYKFGNGVVFASDTRTSNLNTDGSHTGIYTEKLKVLQLRKNMLIGAAGLGITYQTAELLKTILHTENNLNREEVLEFCMENIRFTFNNFIKVNPHIQYTDGELIIGGYDNNLNQSFLYKLSSAYENFTPIELEGNIVTSTPSITIELQVKEFIAARTRGLTNAFDLPIILSESIRSIDHASVGKKTFTYMFFYNEDKGVYQEAKSIFDEEGNLVE